MAVFFDYLSCVSESFYFLVLFPPTVCVLNSLLLVVLSVTSVCVFLVSVLW